MSRMLWSRKQKEQQPNEQTPWGPVHQEQCHAGQTTGQESDINIAEDASQAQVVVTE